MFRVLIALIVVASRVSYLLLRCAPPHGGFFGLSLRSYQFAVSTPFGVHPSVHPRSPRPSEYACGPSFPSRQESAGKSQVPPPQTMPAAPAKHQISVALCLRREGSKFPASYTKSRQSCVGVLFHPLQAQCNPAKVCRGHWLLGDSVDYGVSDHHRTAYVYRSGSIMGKPSVKALRTRPSGRVADDSFRMQN